MKYLIVILAVMLWLPPGAFSATMTGKVIGIADGDTITILTGKTQYKIRLYGIDTPEKAQAFGKAAKKHTSTLVAGKTVDVTTYDTDRYGRTVGVVVADGVNVNRSLISEGLAWQYRKYCKASFCDNWLRLEEKSRTSRIGLWSDTGPVAPWQWRRGARNNSYSKRYTGRYDAAAGEYHGNTKSHVYHSSSCRHYNCKNCNQTFDSIEIAKSSGYRPCGQCKP
jgi:micrococcal nuclease